MILSSDSKLLAIGGVYNTNVDVWNTDSGNLVEHADIQGSGKVNSIVFSGTEPRLLVASTTKIIKELPLARRRDCEGADDEPQVMGDFADPHFGSNWLMSVAISPDENYWVLCSDAYGTVCLWSLDGRPQFIMQADKGYGRMPCPWR
jgi:WD40 repeat protein